MIPNSWHQKFDRLLGIATFPTTMLTVFVLFFSVDDPITTLAAWVLMALFAGAAIGVFVIIAHALLR